MRFPLLTAILMLSPGPLLAATFDLSLDATNAERIVVVARSGGGAAAVAAGDEDLKVLRGEDADRARAKLAKVDIDDAEKTAFADDGDDKKKRKKIVIHKMDFDEDGAAGEEGKREIRILKKTGQGRREEELLLEDDDRLIRDGAAEVTAVERRVIRMKGVDEARAIKFIDETEGLDAGEKAQMKAAVGL